MNKVYAIIYELRTAGRDYTSLYSTIKASGKWWHHLPATWLIYTQQNAAEIWAQLRPHIDENDSMLVIEVGSDSQGWLPETAWEWIQEHEPKTTARTKRPAVANT